MFDPIRTPRLTAPAPFASATSAEVISGPSAASAVRSPSTASGSPSLAPTRSRRRAKKAAAPSVTASDVRKSGTVTSGVIGRAADQGVGKTGAWRSGADQSSRLTCGGS